MAACFLCTRTKQLLHLRAYFTLDVGILFTFSRWIVDVFARSRWMLVVFSRSHAGLPIVRELLTRRTAMSFYQVAALALGFEVVPEWGGDLGSKTRGGLVGILWD